MGIVFLLICFFGIGLIISTDTGQIGLKSNEVSHIFTDKYAELNDEYVATVTGGKARGYISTWSDDAGKKYLFLPSFVQDYSFEDTFSESNDVVIMQSKNIPSVFIETGACQEELDEEKGVEYAGHVHIVLENGTYDACGDLEYIRTRGNSTFELEKKPYEIKFNKKESVLGLPKSKEWILLANAFDSTLIKNKMVFDFVNKYTPILAPKGEFVDLYINGQYRGNYFLCQKIKVQDGFLKLEDLEKSNASSFDSDKSEIVYNVTGTARGFAEDSSHLDISGGYLFELSLIDQAFDNNAFFVSKDNRFFGIKFPKNATLGEAEYCESLINEIIDSLNDEDGYNFDTGKKFDEYLDVESFIYKGLVESMFQNMDSEINSSFFYKNSDKVDGKVYAGPCWDYDLCVYPYMNEWDVDTVGKVYLLDKLLSFPEVRSRYIEIYEEVFKPYFKYSFSNEAYEVFEQISASYDMNSVIWDENSLYKDSYANLDYFIDRTRARVNVVGDFAYGEASHHKVTFLNYDGNEIYPSLYIEDGKTIENIPVTSSYAAIFEGWYRQDNGVKLTAETPIYEDCIYESKWIDFSVLINNGLGNSDYDISEIPAELFEDMAEYIRQKQKNEE